MCCLQICQSLTQHSFLICAAACVPLLGWPASSLLMVDFHLYGGLHPCQVLVQLSMHKFFLPLASHLKCIISPSLLVCRRSPFRPCSTQSDLHSISTSLAKSTSPIPKFWLAISLPGPHGQESKSAGPSIDG